MFTQIYKGIVVDNKDPRDIGRVKVHVPAVYPDFDNDDSHITKHTLPWAEPMLSLFNSGGDNLKNFSRDDENYQDGYQYNKTGTSGIYTVPGQGSHVYVFFEGGNHMHPIYMGADPNESDWLTQKMMVKDRIFLKLEQIRDFKERFAPVDPTTGTDGDGWADGAHVNARMGAEGEGEGGPYPIAGQAPDGLENATEGESQIGLDDTEGGPYAPRLRAIDNAIFQGEGYERIDYTESDNLIPRASGSTVGLDVKPLIDAEEIEGDINRSEFPHKYGDMFDPIAGTGEDASEPSDYNIEDDLRHLNRDITTMVTKGGTTIVIDNREGQENFYLVHKNYLFNVDEFGSVKEFCGQNNVEQPRSPTYNGEEEEDGLQDTTDEEVRADKELGVSGQYKIHVLGNFSTYTKGNAFMQVDRNMQIDVNDSYGVRVRKGDVDIVIEGEGQDEEGGDADDPRGEGSEGVEGPKEDQFGDLNVAVKNGNIELYCKKNANIHVGGQCNLRTEGDFRVHCRKDYHLLVEGDYHEFVNGRRFSTVEDCAEYRYKKNRLTEIDENDLKKVGERNEVATGDLNISSGDWHFSGAEIRVENDIHLNGNFRCESELRVIALYVDEDIQCTGAIKAELKIISLEDVESCGGGGGKGVSLFEHKHKVKGLKVKGRKRRGSKKVTGRTKKGKTKKPKKVAQDCSEPELPAYLLPEPAFAPEDMTTEGAGELPEDQIYDADTADWRTPVSSEEEGGGGGEGDGDDVNSLFEDAVGATSCDSDGYQVKVALRTHDSRSIKPEIRSAVPESDSEE